jgi:hypothetical protein
MKSIFKTNYFALCFIIFTWVNLFSSNELFNCLQVQIISTHFLPSFLPSFHRKKRVLKNTCLCVCVCSTANWSPYLASLRCPRATFWRCWFVAVSVQPPVSLLSDFHETPSGSSVCLCLFNRNRQFVFSSLSMSTTLPLEVLSPGPGVILITCLHLMSRKLRLMTMRDPPRCPRDTPLSTKVGTKFRPQVAVAQSV